LNRGQFTFAVEAPDPAGIGLRWSWHSEQGDSVLLKVRGFWAMRDLHELGGQAWALTHLAQLDGAQRGTIVSRSGATEGRESFCLFRGAWRWNADPLWLESFYYSEEAERGYSATENLYSAGFFETTLGPEQGCDWVSSMDPGTFEQPLQYSFESKKAPRSKIFDFVLRDPAGVVAGFPWFGEWGRDTFVALPGIVGSFIESGIERGDSWVDELMHRWGYWISSHGQIPNVIEKESHAQWESCDGTLWWCHSLAALWMFSLSSPSWFSRLKENFSPLLKQAVASITLGRHPFLVRNKDGLLSVTGSHTTWMDARVQGVAVTPRLGVLPEINALWFQALCLSWVWSGEPTFQELVTLGKKVLECREPLRPNTIFLHSIPLAPSFVLNDSRSLERDLTELSESLWTPLGLRTLSPTTFHFKSHYFGNQEARDLAYHQGPVWAWLGGHFEIARHRLPRMQSRYDKMFPPDLLKEMPIFGHIAELFDAEPPFSPRGAPAQAWSLACFEEARIRRLLKVDEKMKHEIAQKQSQLGRDPVSDSMRESTD
jgi:glycogen debranching enzyme